MNYYLSPNIKEIRYNDKSLLYDSKTGERIIIKNDSLEFIDMIREGKKIEEIKKDYNLDLLNKFINKLVEKKIILDNSDVPDFYFCKTEEEIKKGVLLRNLRLNVTEACNLNCSYCYERISNVWNKKRYMSWNIAKKTIDKFLNMLNEQKAEKVSIRFFGGEPLLNWDVVEKSIVYIKNKKPDRLNINYILNTNGTLLDNIKCKFLSEHKVNIALSLDGINKDHDTYRTYLDGRGSFNIIEKNLEYLTANNCIFNISAVCTDRNLPNINQFIDYLSAKQTELNFKIPICFNFVTIVDGDGIDTLSNEQKVRLLIKGLKYSKEKEINSFGGLTHFVFQSFLDKNIGTHCVASGAEFSVDPDGDIYPCSGVDLKLGNIENFEEIFKTDLYNKLCNHKCGEIKQCSGCEIEGFCGGGCIAETKQDNGEYFGDFKNCELEKLLFRELTKYYILNN